MNNEQSWKTSDLPIEGFSGLKTNSNNSDSVEIPNPSASSSLFQDDREFENYAAHIGKHHLTSQCEQNVHTGECTNYNCNSFSFSDHSLCEFASKIQKSLSLKEMEQAKSPDENSHGSENIPSCSKDEILCHSADEQVLLNSVHVNKSRENTLPLRVRLLDAVDQEDIAAVKHILLVDNIDPNFTINMKNPICRATSLGNIKIMEMLMASGAYPDTPNSFDLVWKRHPIHIAASKGHLSALKLLVKNGANINQPDSDQRSPLHWVAMYGEAYLVKWMLEAGAIVNITQSDGFTPLHTATCLGHREVCRLLIDGGADLCQRDCEGWTPLHTAVCYGYIDIVSLLLEKGACPLATTGMNRDSTLHLACSKGRLDIVELMLDKGVPIESRNSFGFTPLLIAVFYNRVDVAFHLVKKGANVNAVNLTGTSPIYLSVVRCELELIRLLLLAGCNVPKDLTLTVSQHSLSLAAEINYHCRIPRTLRDQCQVAIRQSLSPDLQEKGRKLPLPDSIKRKLVMEELSMTLISQISDSS